MSTKEKVLGTLLMPLIAAFVLSGMAVAECFTVPALIVCVASFIVTITLALILRRGA